jgi:hypothetical protein
LAEHRRVLLRCSPDYGFPLFGVGAFNMPRVEDNHVVESTTEARAAVTGHNVRYVLLISTLAVIVLFAVAYLVTRG